MHPMRFFIARLCLTLLILLALVPIVHAEGSAQELIQKGDAYLRSNSVDQAIGAYSEAINIDPNLPTAYSKRGIAYLLMKHDPESALPDLTKSIELGSTSGFTYYFRGTIYTSRGLYDAALRDFTKAIEFKSDLSDAYSYRGLIYARKGKPELAVADLTKAIELNTYDLFAAYINRGGAYKSLGRIDLAIADYSKAIQVKPQEVEGYITRGHSYMLAGKPLLAVKDYNYVIKLMPDVPSTYNYLSYAFEDADAFDSAIEANNNFLKKAAPGDPYVDIARIRLRYLQDLKAAMIASHGVVPKFPPSITAADGSIVSNSERQAIITGVSLMEAYNSKDLNKVRAINIGARYLTDDQVNQFLGYSKGWTLRAVEVLSSTGTRINARMVYSREISNPNYIGRNFSYSISLITLCYIDGQWRVIREPKETGLDLFSIMEVAAKTTKKYGVDDLSKWVGLSQK